MPESRSLYTPREVRAEKRADGKMQISGYAAVFYRAGEPGTEYKLYEDLFERIAPAAFERALREGHDVRALFNHDPNQLLGRVKSQTLRLSVDAVGLMFEIDLPDTQVGRDVFESVKRGDLSGSSFAFRPTGVSWMEEGERTIRTVLDVDLYDVGPVAFPAYEATSVGQRSAAAARTEADERRKQITADRDDVDVRTAIVKLTA